MKAKRLFDSLMVLLFSAALGASADTLDQRRLRNLGHETNYLTAVSFGNGQWIAVGSHPTGALGYDHTILTSPDAINWTARKSGTGRNLLGVGYGNALWVAVGTGAILTSGEIVRLLRLSITRSSTNAVVTWPADAAGFVLETTTGLAALQIWRAMTNTSAVVNSQNSITDAISASGRFYRLRQQ